VVKEVFTMTFKEFIQQLMYLVITGILPFVTVYFANFVKSIIQKNKDNIENEQIQNLIEYAGEAISVAVMTVSQTYVDTMKRQGKFDADAQAIAKQMAIDKAKELISKEMKSAIETVYTNFDAYLDNYIETIVRESKIEVK